MPTALILHTKQSYDVIIVGAGIAGLTSAAFLSKSGCRVLLIEKENKNGGLLGAIKIEDHKIDHGARGIINSGVFIPMMKQLGLNIELLPNPIKITVGNKSVTFKDRSSIDDYGSLLKELYPEHQQEIDHILKDIKKVMEHMDVLYGIENPLFMSKPYDYAYMLKTLLPWMVKFVLNIRQAMKLLEPINDHLRRITDNESLIHIITQHFFENTPTFFALSYFSLYLDYQYPRGSTQVIVDSMAELIQDNQGQIINGHEVVHIDISNRQVWLKEGQNFTYNQLIWAADLNTLYKCLDAEHWPSSPLKEKVQQKQNFLATKKGADSVLSLYIIVDQPPERFESISGPHAFYTPTSEGMSGISLSTLMDNQMTFINNQDKIFGWLKTFFKQNTYEISIPALRDPSLSPPGETALIVSVLFDYKLTKHIADLGLFEEFKTSVTEMIVSNIELLFYDLSNHIIKTVLTTPLTIANKTNNTEGSLTGWSFANQPFPAEYRFLKISQSVITPIDNIKQAGQWTFNPAGVPVSILTGKLAADAVLKDLNKSN
jgi:phytoene dehydrogenase-like protein